MAEIRRSPVEVGLSMFIPLFTTGFTNIPGGGFLAGFLKRQPYYQWIFEAQGLGLPMLSCRVPHVEGELKDQLPVILTHGRCG